MKLALITLLVLTTGCAAKHAYNAMYCDRWSDDHKHCLSYAKKPYPCVSNDQTGGCTTETK